MARSSDFEIINRPRRSRVSGPLGPGWDQGLKRVNAGVSARVMGLALGLGVGFCNNKKITARASFLHCTTAKKKKTQLPTHLAFVADTSVGAAGCRVGAGSRRYSSNSKRVDCFGKKKTKVYAS